MHSHCITAILSALLSALLTSADPRVDLAGGYMGLAMTGSTCKNARSIACTELDDDWPDMGLACPKAHHGVPRHTLAIMSATVIQLGHYRRVKKEDFPLDQCYTSKPNSTAVGYGFVSQGTFDMWFFAHDKCDCKPDQTPVCHSRASEADKCNLRTFTLCKVTKKDEICSPKHHEGWKPLPTVIEGAKKPVNSSNPTVHIKIAFDPTQRSRNRFNDLSTAWWRVMEVLGFWGAI